MTKQFSVGDKVKYTSPFNEHNDLGVNEHNDLGVIVEVNLEYFECASGEYRAGYLIRWSDGNQYWIAGYTRSDH